MITSFYCSNVKRLFLSDIIWTNSFELHRVSYTVYITSNQFALTQNTVVLSKGSICKVDVLHDSL